MNIKLPNINAPSARMLELLAEAQAIAARAERLATAPLLPHRLTDTARQRLADYHEYVRNVSQERGTMYRKAK